MPWVRQEARAALDQQFAAEAVLIDSGMAAQARAHGDFWGLQGFETSNRLHPDDPAHWHFSYVLGVTGARWGPRSATSSSTARAAT